MYEFMSKHNLSSRSFDSWPDELMREFLIEINNFVAVRKLEDGTVVGVMLLYSTVSVCTDIEPLTPFKYRWCFQDADEAKEFYLTLKDFDEVPAPEKRKSLVGHRYTRKPLIMEYDALGLPKW